MDFHIVGVDPGLSGAIACIGPGGMLWQAIQSTPTLTLKQGKKTKHEHDLAEMRKLVDGLPRPLVAAVELTHSMPGQGVRSMWSMGFGVGVWEGLFAGMEIGVTRVAPQTWRRVMLAGVKREGKDASVWRAKQLWPKVKLNETNKGKREGQAEALLIAEWCRRSIVGLA